MGMRSNLGLGLLASVIGATLHAGSVQAQQLPIPKTAAEVPRPALGPMTPAYVQMVGRMAYLWGWPLVYVYNQRTALTKLDFPHFGPPD